MVGVVVDVEFDAGKLPSIHNALMVQREHEEPLILEIQEHVGTNVVRAIAMGSTAGLRRGLPVIDLDTSIQVPVGRQTLGRLFNVLGKPIDGLGEIIPEKNDAHSPQTARYQRPGYFKEHDCHRYQGN